MRIDPCILFPELAALLYDRFVCTRPNLERQSRRKGVRSSGALKFSVAIPIHNRGRLIHRPLFNLLDHPGVQEIVIYDDFSDQSDFAELQKTIASLKASVPIRLFRQTHNRKALVNKRSAVAECRSDWVLLLDSDNTAFQSFLDALTMLTGLDDNAFYCASFAFPRFRFHDVGYEPLDFSAASRMTADGRLKRCYFMNDGNCLVNRRVYLEVSSLLGDPIADEADAMLVNYELLSQGGVLQLLRDTAYYHRIEKAGRWLRNAGASKRRLMAIFERLSSGRRSDAAFRDSLCQNGKNS